MALSKELMAASTPPQLAGADACATYMNRLISTTIGAVVLAIWNASVWAAGASASTVDFRYSPPEWQTAICLPDDPQKSLVDRNGDLLYHYNQGGREFATRVGVQVTTPRLFVAPFRDTAL